MMQEFLGTFFPDGEEHLIDWCKQTRQFKQGHLCYQLNKYRPAMKYLGTGPRRLAVDVGAHIGQWSRVMAMDFENVEAFEPVKLYRECWNSNLMKFDNVILHPEALGCETGEVTLVNRTPGSFGDTQIMMEFEEGDSHSVMGTADMKTLDGFNFTDVDFLKIDCEGYELNVLRGAELMLIQNKPVVIVEQKPGMAQRFGLPETGAVDFLQDLGAELKETIAGDFILAWA